MLIAYFSTTLHKILMCITALQGHMSEFGQVSEFGQAYNRVVPSCLGKITPTASHWSPWRDALGDSNSYVSIYVYDWIMVY